MHSFIEIYDFLLLILYVGIFSFFVKKYASKHVKTSLQKYYYAAFYLRILGCVLYSLVIVFYYGYGDSITFFRGGNMFTEQFAKNTSNLQYIFSSIPRLTDWHSTLGSEDYIGDYFTQPSGSIIMKISALLSYICFNRFLIISLFFALFSFAGQWKLFEVFDDINQGRNRKLLAFAVLFSPSIWFWGSGLMKDSLCLGSLGFIVSFIYNWYKKKQFSFKNFIFIIILGILVSVVKFYVLGILLCSLGVTLAMLLLKKIQNVFLKFVLFSFLSLSVFVLFMKIDISSFVNDAIEDAVNQIKNFQSMYETITADDENSKGSFNMGEINPTIGGILSRAPGVVLSCLYRPFFWESRKIMIFFTSIESLVLMLCTLYLLFKTKFYLFFKAIFTNEFLFFCFTLSILFALVIGFTTFNFGTMIRYKIIFLPFFYFMLVYIYTFYVQKKSK